jgi:hypothetical protein
MTVIIGIRAKGKVYLGADNGAWQHLFQVSRREGKLFQCGSLFFGLAGYPRLRQIIQGTRAIAELVPPKRAANSEWLVTQLVPLIQKAAADNGYLEKENDVKRFTGSELIIAWKGNLATMDCSFHINQTLDDFEVIGAGRELAAGSLFSTKGQPPKKRLKTALEAACRFCAWCAPPFQFGET